jgi:uncharacterized repeat protein (TIGR03806 family)
MNLKLLPLLCALLAFIPATPAQLVRTNNTTLHFPVNSGSIGGYELADALAGLQFDRPVAIATPPGENNRLFVVERAGRIWAIHNLASPVKELFLDITDRVNASDWKQTRRTEGLSSLAFHPNFTNNQRFFVTYNTITTTADGTGHHNRVAEFRASNDNLTALADSEIPIITQYDEGDGHNINDLHFGPDGFLYIATGDEGDGGTGDDFNNAQRIDKDFFSAIMRIDIDSRTNSVAPNPHNAANTSAYKIPADNPYVDATSFNGLPVNPAQVRTEFYAVGLRNPWRFSFDPLTQKIYEGDVGQHGREEVNVIVKGGNYGWSYKEGTLNGPKFGAMPNGFDPIPPIYEYGTGFGTDQGFSVTGGVVYRGSGIPALGGHLIFADYVSGNVWAMNIDAQPYVKPTRLFGQVGIAGFGYDPRNDEVLFVCHDTGRIMRLHYSTGVPETVPPSLDQTGIFSDLATLTPNPGIYAYDINSPLWSDGAIKQRWFYITNGQKMTFHPETNWGFPSGSVWVKQFDLQFKEGDPASVRRIETRVLVKTDTGVYGLSYRWNTNGDNAFLVPDAGDTRGMIIATANGNRRQTWKFPSRSDCLTCHTAAGGRVLGFATEQMNRDHGYGSVTTNQIAALSSAGFFANPPAHANGLRALAPLEDTTASLTFRARSYLAANCGSCHQPGGNLYTQWDARVATPLSAAHIFYGPLANSVGDDKVVVPGSIDRTAILKRMKSTGPDRMPPLGVSIIDTNAVQLISDWVMRDLPQFESFEAWSQRVFGSVVVKKDDADADGILNMTEYLLGTDPKQTTTGVSTMNPNGSVSLRQPANRGVVFETSNDPTANNWRLLDHPQNQIRFPMQATDWSLTNLFSNDPQRFYRMRVIEP